jgi:hypothetical protein
MEGETSTVKRREEHEERVKEGEYSGTTMY